MYKCVYGFSVEMVGEDGFPLENEYLDIMEGTVWSKSDELEYRYIEGEVRLENEDGEWIEITNDMFEMFFEQIQ